MRVGTWLRKKTAMEPEAPLIAIWGVAIYHWGGKLRKSEQVGGRAHAPKRCSTHSFVWYGGGDDHLDRCGDAFLVLKLSSAQLIIERTPYATSLENAKTSGAAQQNTSMTWAVMRSIGRRFATCVK